MGPDNSDNTNSKKASNSFKFIKNVLIVAVIFSVGAFFGLNAQKWGVDRVYQQSLQKNDAKLDYSELEEVYGRLRDNFDGQLDESKLNDGIKQGLVSAAGDPYTEYLNASDSKDFSNDLEGTFEGIGAELSKKDKYVEIVSPISGYPAEKVGLRAKDVIAEINGESAYDITVSEAVKKIRGPKGSTVKLKVVRDGKSLDFEVTREKISIPSVTSEVVDGVGVIKISRYGNDTAELAQKAAQDLKSKNVSGVVLDLRNNPGGLLDAAVDVSSLWVDKGSLVVEEKRGGKTIKKLNANGGNILKGMPTVVLINEGSASASEITAGALRDTNVASLLGEKSYGKGSVQQIVQLGNGATLKVTIARWFTPAGKNIDKEGIKPDQEVKNSDEDITAKRDTQKDTAIAKLKK